MCEAVVYCRPRAMNRNSRANSVPVSRPAPRVPWRKPSQPPRQHISRPTRAAAMPERMAACMTGAMSVAAHLMVTCWMPQITQSNSIVWKAKASADLRMADSQAGMEGSGRQRRPSGSAIMDKPARPVEAWKRPPAGRGRRFRPACLAWGTLSVLRTRHLAAAAHLPVLILLQVRVRSRSSFGGSISTEYSLACTSSGG